MSATLTAGLPLPARDAPLIGAREKLRLGLELTVAMVAAGLLLIATFWRYALPEDRALADLVAGGAAILVAIPVLVAAWHSLRAPSLHGITDRLVALALIASWAAGDLLTAATLPIIMILGHVLEERSLLGSQEAIRALARLTDTTARRLAPNGTVTSVPSDQLREGDRLLLLAGDRIPADGIIEEGHASLDLASLTGESLPVLAGPGDAALAGGIDTDGRLVVRVTRVGEATTLGKIIGLLHEAEAAKPAVTRVLDRNAGPYLALVLSIAAGTWFFSGDTAAALAVLVAACPCALVLAAPATAIAAIAVAARHGILIKGTAFLERLADVTSVLFDKTGTITRGTLTYTGFVAVDGTQGEAHAIAAALGASSSHPVSRAAAALAESPPAHDVQELGGLGLIGWVDGARAGLGRAELFAAQFGMTPPLPPHDGPLAGVAYKEDFIGWLLFADTPRPEARAAIADLADLGIARQSLLTGDRAAVAQKIAAAVGLSDITAEALPAQKLARVNQAIARGEVPMVVGDGINDTLALRAGAVGVAMGAAGTDVALASADLVLMTSDLRRLGTCVRLSRRCRRTIHANVAIGLGWTLLMVVLAAAGLLGAEGALVAALLHNVGTLAGMANAGRLLLFDETAAPA